MTRTWHAPVLAILAALSCGLAARADDARDEARKRNKAAVTARYEQDLTRYKGREDVLVVPGLVADRAGGEVRLLAEATGLGRQETVEFFLIAEDSGNDYEALAVAFAKPSDVHKALEFLGMQPGLGVDPAALRFWSKGERVTMTVRSAADPAAFAPVRAETLVVDRRTGKPLPALGFVFTGSRRIDPPRATADEAPPPPDAPKAYAADVQDPRSIAANYNERDSVLDVPRQAPQHDVYEYQVVNPDCVLKAGELLEIAIAPEYRDGRRRVTDLLLAARPREGGDRTLAGVALTLTASKGDTLAADAPIDAALARFAAMAEAGQDPFVTLQFDGGLSLGAVRDLCRVLTSVDTAGGIRVEPPRKGDLYYRAFVPDESFRSREKRIAQPWELHLQRAAGAVTGTLVQIEQIFKDESIWPDLKPTDYAVGGPRDLRRELDAHGPGLPVILVYAAPEITVGALMQMLEPALPTHGTVHVFLDEPERTEAQPPAPPAD